MCATFMCGHPATVENAHHHRPSGVIFCRMCENRKPRHLRYIINPEQSFASYGPDIKAWRGANVGASNDENVRKHAQKENHNVGVR